MSRLVGGAGPRETLRRVMLWLLVVIALVYAGSLTGTFHFDDSHSVENNVYVRSLANIPSFWTDPRTSSFIPENRVYRPMVYTLYAFCWALGDGATWPFHLAKILMHWGMCVLIFLVWRRLWSEPGWLPAGALRLRLPFDRGAGFALDAGGSALVLATLFAVHPAVSENVIYISATTSLQCALFYLGAFWAYLRWRDHGRGRDLAFSLILFFLSVASKEEGITLPAMVALTEVFLSGRLTATTARARGTLVTWGSALGQALRRSAPFAVLALALAAWILVMRPQEGHESRGYATSLEYFMTQWRAYLWYMRLWFWPWDLNADATSVEFSRSFFDPLVLQALIGNLSILTLAWALRRRVPALLYGLVWFYVTISPASSVVVLAEAVNEHRMYLAYVGFVGGTFATLLWLLDGLASTEPADRATVARRIGHGLGAVVVGLVIGTQERNRVWRNEENLWLDTVEKNPTSGRAYNNLALVYLGRGEHEKAISYLEKCEQHWTAYSYCPLNRGISLQALGRLDEAEKAFDRAYQLNPRNVHTNYYMGGFHYRARKNLARAVQHYRAAIDLTGNRNPAASAELAELYASKQDWNGAREAASAAVALEPANPEYLFRLARIEQMAGRLSPAEGLYLRLLREAPSHAMGWYNYGVLKVQLSDFRAARDAFEKAVELDPRSEQGWYNLAFVGEQLQDKRLAQSAARTLAQLYPQKPEYAARVESLRKKFGPEEM